MTAVFLRYTLLRLVLLVVVLVALAAAGARGIVLLVLTAVITAALSYVLLRRQRDAVAAVLVERERTRIAGTPPRPGTLAGDAAAEDAEADGLRSRVQPGEEPSPAESPTPSDNPSPKNTP